MEENIIAMEELEKAAGGMSRAQADEEFDLFTKLYYERMGSAYPGKEDRIRNNFARIADDYKRGYRCGGGDDYRSVVEFMLDGVYCDEYQSRSENEIIEGICTDIRAMRA